MVYKRLYIQLIIRVLLLLATCIALSRIIFSPQYFHTAIVLSVVLLIETIELTIYLNRTNRQLAKFFASILDQGSSLTLNENKHTGSFRELIQKLREVNKLIQDERRERKAEYTYLNYLIENIGVGVVTYKENGHIGLINPAAKKIFSEDTILNLSDFNKFNPEFEEAVKALDLNEGALIRIIVQNELFYLTVRKSLFKLQGDPIFLLSFQDINSELDKKELESWQKIIRVLTHEIMSSISPVCSLSEHLHTKTKELHQTGLVDKVVENRIEDLLEGLDIIKQRGDGLMDFVAHYHSLTHLPVPDMKESNLDEFLERTIQLIKPECSKNNIRISAELSGGTVIRMDPKLIQQVLINLFNNSIQALQSITSDKHIAIKASRSDDLGVQVTVKDNGCGIDTENMDNIFIPFYTTKETGSGIGLSFSKQIMRLHNGRISVKSDPGKETEITLMF